MHKRSLSLFISLIAIAALCKGFIAEARAMEVGVGVHMGLNRQNYTQATEAFSDSGITSFRDEVFWHRLEVKKGVLKFPESLKDLDRVVSESKAKGIRPILILDYGNKFYDDGDIVVSDEAISAFVRYAQFVVEYFKGRVETFEVWNEWNIGMGSPKKPRSIASPEAYVRLLKPTYLAIKKIDPSIKVIGGGIAGLDDKWVFRFGMDGGFAYLDGLSVHPYVHDRGGVGTPEYVFNWLDKLKLRVDGFSPKREMPMYITEIGWPTNTGTYGISEALASAYYERFMLLAKTRPWIAGVWWYDLIDDGPNSADKEHRFGMFRQNLKPKPVAESAMRLTPMLKDIASATSKTDSNKVVNWTGKTTAGKTVTARWLNAYDENASVTPATNGRSLMAEPIGIRPKIEVSR